MTIVWGAIVLAPWVPGVLGEFQWSVALGLSSSPHLRTFLHLFILSDVFATYAIVRPPGYHALGAARPALVPLWGHGAWRRTGRAMAGFAMLLLAAISMAAMLLLGPGLVLA